MDDDDFMDTGDGEDYGFEYESDDGEEPDVDLENQYYNAKALKEDSPKDALAAFQKVVAMETEKGDWGFKALKQMVKLYFRLNNTKACLDTYKQLLTYIKSAVTRNYSEKSINSILDHISGSAEMDFLEMFYSATLATLGDSQNERLYFKTNIKLAKLWLDRGEYVRLNKILRALHQACVSEDGSDDTKKGTQLLEIYALEIQMYTATRNNKKLKELYNLSLRIKSAIPHPRIMGVIRECGGKMHMSEGQWEQGHKDFFEAFKNYDEAGSPRRIQCLKYLLLANMLMLSDIDPFTAQETKPYKNDPEITAMTNLVSAHQRREITEFEKILRDNRKTIMDDPFIRDHIEDLLTSIRTGALLDLIKPYTRIDLSFISRHLNITPAEVESLLVSLILDSKIDGRIDQVNQRLELRQHGQETNLYTAMDRWTKQVSSLTSLMTDRIA